MEKVGIKVRNYELEPTFLEFGNTVENIKKYEKILASDRVNVYFDKDIYLSMSAYDDLKYILNCSQVKRTVGENMAMIEQYIDKFLRDCFIEKSATFDEPDYQYFKINKEPYFDYY